MYKKLACDTVQEKRIKHRWNDIEQDNQEFKQAKKEGEEYNPHIFENGDTLKQLLVRSRYLLFKPMHKWSHSQKERSEIILARN